MKPLSRLSLTLPVLFFSAQLFAQSSAPNNTLRGRVLYQSSGNKPAKGVRIKETDSNGDYSKDNGDYRLVFQTKRNGATLALEVGPDTRDGKKIELVNEKELKAAKLPAGADELLDIIVCPAGQRDIAAQKYYRILRTTADRELERKKKEVEDLLTQKEKDYQRISDLFAQLDGMQAALDSAKIREQAFSIASINLDRASQLVKDAVRKIDEENDVEGALKILNAEALDTAYEHASAVKKHGQKIIKKADAEIQQVIEGYEFKISLLEPQYKYGEMAECYEKLVGIYEKEGFDQNELADYVSKAASNWGRYGDNEKRLDFHLKALSIREKILPPNHPDLASSYNNVGEAYGGIGDHHKRLEYAQKGLGIREKILPAGDVDLAISYDHLAMAYSHLGDHKKALTILENHLPKNDEVDLATCYNNLAYVYGENGDFQKQLEYNLKTLAIRERILPADHPNTATTYNNLATTYFNLRDYQKSIEYNLKAITIREKVLPTEHPDLAVSYNNVALAYGNLSEYQKQLEFNLKAMTIREKFLPADHPDLGISYSNIGRAYRDVGEYQKGIEYGQKAVKIGEASNPKSSYLNRFHANLGITYLKVHKYPEAKAALEKSESLKPEERVYRGWALYYALQKKKKLAIEYLQKAIALGFKDIKWLEKEPDLKNIRKEKGYKDLVEQLKKQ